MTPRILLYLCVLLVVRPNLVQANSVTNGDFTAALTGWTTEGDVTTDNEEAVLGDDGVTYSLLFQGVPLGPGTYALEFDFLNGLSSTPDNSTPPFSFFDVFFASLYFIDDLSQFDLDPLNPVFDEVTPLFDLDASGVFNLTGSVGASVKGGDWQHYSLLFQPQFAYAIPTFELVEQNFIDADSTVRIDNVSIELSAVPEPGTLLLLGSGLLVIGRITRRQNVRRAVPATSAE